MKIYNLNSDYFFNQEVEGLLEDVDEYNTDIAPPTDFIRPRYIDGVWSDVTDAGKESIDLSNRLVIECQIARSNAYPAIAEQLDAFWKGGEDAEAMRLQIVAVKNQYPKP